MEKKQFVARDLTTDELSNVFKLAQEFEQSNLLQRGIVVPRVAVGQQCSNPTFQMLEERGGNAKIVVVKDDNFVCKAALLVGLPKPGAFRVKEVIRNDRGYITSVVVEAITSITTESKSKRKKS